MQMMFFFNVNYTRCNLLHIGDNIIKSILCALLSVKFIFIAFLVLQTFSNHQEFYRSTCSLKEPLMADR